ncbi:MAG: hypothetical protein KIH10_16300 [Candidatus Freyarchaeota archaeon]|nr:hypothetical protein [Candidatus Jordarchaeia archaeon]
MSEIVTLKEKAEQTPEYISVTDIPPTVTAKLASDLTFKADKRGNEACFITLETPDKKRIVQKYTPSTYKYLYEAILNSGGIDYLKTNYVEWKKERLGRAINERLYPTPKKKAK